jgi:hypothetical protein
MKGKLVSNVGMALTIAFLAVGAGVVGGWGCGDGDDDNCGPVPSSCSSIADDACGTCIGSCCCSEVTTCAASSACMDLLECIVGCTTDSCIESCLTTYPSGETPLLNYLECVDAKCGSASKCGS